VCISHLLCFIEQLTPWVQALDTGSVLGCKDDSGPVTYQLSDI
jgi:hypothetical protein